MRIENAPTSGITPEFFQEAFQQFQQSFLALGFVPDGAYGPYGLVLKADEKPYAVAWCYPPECLGFDVPPAQERSFCEPTRLLGFEDRVAEIKHSGEIAVLGCIGQGRMCSDAYLFNDAESLKEALSMMEMYGRNCIERGPLGALGTGRSQRTVACSTEAFDEYS